MRLIEIIDTKSNTIQLNKPFDMKKIDADYLKHMDSPTAGTYARGEEIKDDPHLYKKQSHYPSNLELDAYYSYVQHIKPLIGGNPFFPRVYVVNLKKDLNGKVIPSYNIEKLSTPDNFSTEALIAMCKTLFHNVPDLYDVDDIQEFYADQIGDALQSENYSNIKNTKLKQALELIVKIKNSTDGFSYDTSLNNFMFRGTPYGPQLVLTDPLYDFAQSIITQ